MEADRKPIFAFEAKKHKEVEAFCADERVLTKLRSVSPPMISLPIHVVSATAQSAEGSTATREAIACSQTRISMTFHPVYSDGSAVARS